jgi:hypothetical protein
MCTSHTALFSPPDFQTPFKYIQNQKGLISAMRSNSPLTPSEITSLPEFNDILNDIPGQKK